jgi:nucleotide sugar dehydrogenase
MNKYKILIVGYGNIGKHMQKELCSFNPDIYDPYISEYSNKKDIRYDFAFICVPTDMKEDGSADISIVEDAVKSTNAEIIVIKSAVPVGTCEYLANNYNNKIIISPEYYGTTIYSEESPDFLVLGGASDIASKVAELYYRIKPSSFRIKFTDYRTAELAKYMENCFLALKVTFCNEFADICDLYGISYPELREVFILDKRMGDSHTYVFQDQRYYDSHCLNKDIPALIKQSEDGKGNNVAELMKKVFEINLKKKKKFHK